MSKSCSCPNTHCENHGNCEACRASHAKKDYPSHCQRD